jgi:hypothetical protein
MRPTCTFGFARSGDPRISDFGLSALPATIVMFCRASIPASGDPRTAWQPRLFAYWSSLSEHKPTSTSPSNAMTPFAGRLKSPSSAPPLVVQNEASPGCELESNNVWACDGNEHEEHVSALVALVSMLRLVAYTLTYPSATSTR